MAAPRAAESLNDPDLKGAYTIRFTTRLEYQARGTETQRKLKKKANVAFISSTGIPWPK
jgi:hypothetical protein